MQKYDTSTCKDNQMKYIISHNVEFIFVCSSLEMFCCRSELFVNLIKLTVISASLKMPKKIISMKTLT